MEPQNGGPRPPYTYTVFFNLGQAGNGMVIGKVSLELNVENVKSCEICNTFYYIFLNQFQTLLSIKCRIAVQELVID